MKKTPQNLLLTLLLFSSLVVEISYSSLELLNTNPAVTITDFDEGDNGEV